MSRIYCDCSYTDGGDVSVSRHEVRTARKPHQCVECQCTIKRGERYEYSTMCSDGSWSDAKTCISCSNIARAHCPRGYMVGELAVTIRECRGFDYRDDPAKWDQDEVDAEDAANRLAMQKLKARQEQDHFGMPTI